MEILERQFYEGGTFKSEREREFLERGSFKREGVFREGEFLEREGV